MDKVKAFSVILYILADIDSAQGTYTRNPVIKQPSAMSSNLQ
jgi:hypothetical protein